jgi:hypothetical protein
MHAVLRYWSLTGGSREMTTHGERPEQSKFLRHIVIPVLIPFFVGAFGFAAGAMRSDASHETELEQMRPDIQKIRAMPDPSQVVTKDQLTEIVRRLDERTETISQDVKYLREREEKRSR